MTAGARKGRMVVLCNGAAGLLALDGHTASRLEVRHDTGRLTTGSGPHNSAPRTGQPFKYALSTEGLQAGWIHRGRSRPCHPPHSAAPRPTQPAMPADSPREHPHTAAAAVGT
jgi:hypothetical protein